MHPVLFTIFEFPVPSYGTMLALSFLLGIFIAVRLAKKRGLSGEVIADLALYVIISAVIGARIYYVMTHFDEFRGDLFSIVNPFSDGRIGISGLVMYGGFIASIIAATTYFKIKKLPILTYLDVCSPSVGVGIALTRIGCFLNGCCYGAAAKAGSFLSINYPPVGSPAGHYQRYIGAEGLLPSQFFESMGGLAIFLILILAGRSKKYFHGLQFYLLIVLYAVLRFFVETTRYIETQKIGPFSHNQIICIALFTVFGYLIVKNFIATRKQLRPQ
ncbi:MAG: prolipoprotein diacylglyceryl transferase [Chitinispirillales bacterium]|jgi:phosphatidylglycerol:prolipoprotein diacylglycerol transferase|nr:prolipoprotein diacylglyceryl transferase [Chitinispirillales bacterium]